MGFQHITMALLKMKIAIQNFLFKLGYNVSRSRAGSAIGRRQLETFFSRFREKYVCVDLLRIGGQGDGGYLVPDCLGDIKYCFSAGVSDIADFEQDLAKRYNITSFMADGSVEAAPVQGDHFKFMKKFIGNGPGQQDYITLSDWIRQTIGHDDSPKILQMDIEGGEFDVLICESIASFSVAVIEFHGLHRMFNPGYLDMISSIFKKIYRDFSICHVHPNNHVGHLGVHESCGIQIPDVIEVSFIRNDLIDRCRRMGQISLPHEFDRKNVSGQDDIVMPDIWWKS